MFTVIQKCLTFLNYKMSTLSDFRRVKINLIPHHHTYAYIGTCLLGRQFVSIYHNIKCTYSSTPAILLLEISTTEIPMHTLQKSTYKYVCYSIACNSGQSTHQ